MHSVDSEYSSHDHVYVTKPNKIRRHWQQRDYLDRVCVFTVVRLGAFIIVSQEPARDKKGLTTSLERMRAKRIARNF
jgi:hypothetical protein